MPRPMIARLATTAALAALALSALPAAAQTEAQPEAGAEVGAPAGPGPMMSPLAGVDVAPLLFGAMDADGDGTISTDELAAAVADLDPRMQAALVRALVDADDRRAAMAEAMVARLDTDGDGVLSAEELAAGMAARAEERAAWRADMQDMRAARGAERGRSSWCDDRPSERMGARPERGDAMRGRGDGPRGYGPRGDGAGRMAPPRN